MFKIDGYFYTGELTDRAPLLFWTNKDLLYYIDTSAVKGRIRKAEVVEGQHVAEIGLERYSKRVFILPKELLVC